MALLCGSSKALLLDVNLTILGCFSVCYFNQQSRLVQQIQQAAVSKQKLHGKQAWAAGPTAWAWAAATRRRRRVRARGSTKSTMRVWGVTITYAQLYAGLLQGLQTSSMELQC
mmetsp:Transcript_8641/g.14879  ORF Transcript_8641/g.14879 Transcript_8641/m.14879 type:complete len:113 (-) Transcript_8641:855-1193(-)